MASDNGMVPAARLAEVRERGVLVTRVGSHAVALFAAGEAVHAVDNRCPHMGFPLDRGSVKDGILTCHWHEARFELASGCTFDLFADDAVTFATEIRGDTVWVATRPRQVRDSAYHRRRLRRGMEQGVGLVQAKSLISLLHADGGPVPDAALAAILSEVVAYAAANVTSFGEGLVRLTCVARLAPYLRPETLYLGMSYAVRQLAAEANAGAPPRPRDPLATTLPVAVLKRWLAGWVRTRHRDAVERTLLTGVAGRLPAADLADLLYGAAAERLYANTGHLFDACNKALELIDALDGAAAAPLAALLAPTLAGARGEEESTPWHHPVEIAAAVRAAGQRLPEVLAAAGTAAAAGMATGTAATTGPGAAAAAGVATGTAAGAGATAAGAAATGGATGPGAAGVVTGSATATAAGTGAAGAGAAGTAIAPAAAGGARGAAAGEEAAGGEAAGTATGAGTAAADAATGRAASAATAGAAPAAGDAPAPATVAHEDVLVQDLLGDDPLAVIAAVEAALAAGEAPAAVGAAITHAAGLRLARFATSNEVSDWFNPQHTFIFCNAVQQSLLRSSAPDVVRALYQAAIAVYMDRYLNVPPAKLPAERRAGTGRGNGAAAAAADTGEPEATAGGAGARSARGNGTAVPDARVSLDPGVTADTGEPDPTAGGAGAGPEPPLAPARARAELLQLLNNRAETERAADLVSDYLRTPAADWPAALGRLVDTIAFATLREDLDFHSLQVLEAATTQLAARGNDRGAEHIMIGVIRNLAAHCPTRRAGYQTAMIARRLQRGEELFA